MGEIGLTEQLAQFAAGTTYDSVPEEVVAAAKRAVLGAMAATIAGRQRDNNGAT
jgi:2-methylcitrate dehydratase PrpD